MTATRGIAPFTNPTTLLFFTRTPAGREAAAFQGRLKPRRTGRDRAVTPGVFHAQLRAVNGWGHSALPATSFAGPMLILHGDSDRMVAVGNADALLARYPDADVRALADSGRDVSFQNRASVTGTFTRFLQR